VLQRQIESLTMGKEIEQTSYESHVASGSQIVADFSAVERAAYRDLPRFIGTLWVALGSCLTLYAIPFCISGFVYRLAFLQVFGKSLTGDDFSFGKTVVNGYYAQTYHPASFANNSDSEFSGFVNFVSIVTLVALVTGWLASKEWFRRIFALRDEFPLSYNLLRALIVFGVVLAFFSLGGIIGVARDAGTRDALRYAAGNTVPVDRPSLSPFVYYAQPSPSDLPPSPMIHREPFRPVLRSEVVRQFQLAVPHLLDTLNTGHVFVFDEDSDGYDVFIVGKLAKGGKPSSIYRVERSAILGLR
jgi:hypothetical protein